MYSAARTIHILEGNVVNTLRKVNILPSYRYFWNSQHEALFPDHEIFSKVQKKDPPNTLFGLTEVVHEKPIVENGVRNDKKQTRSKRDYMTDTNGFPISKRPIQDTPLKSSKKLKPVIITDSNGFPI